ncbi:phosphoribosylaminoimidazolesuccinocarboxamide synthase [Quadrisphaera sp. DSM 44207]|uniref:phosphoribosylaminoimidazolesuccinocarboxamide synthase n=1 Tax=Quadrisphaera sp. DSM 44207 TaxID=1881057 RepID=UPI00088BB16E|nr:phosphoribosylaminoimidazolesuccinocarboxamide synthase [Quadrisphaera sp. DSM 44207]SDQ87191.1 phosphoribosylaminoimidazole-succinocarboxamide synthase [Quadrisphaera sp. DSM 44207]
MSSPHPPRPSTDLPGWRPLHAGKVRELYVDEADESRVLVVATDRISAYDRVLPTPVPDKGAILTALSLWWSERLDEWDLDLPHHALLGEPVPDAVAGRAMVCRHLRMLPVECIARGYLTGSALADYRATGAVGGVELPDGLRDGDRLRVPLFTPSTKADVGSHDENVNLAAVAELVGEDLASQLRAATLGVYERAAALAAERGVIIADTKLELGLAPAPDGREVLVLGDEVLTPDSSRFWPAEAWEPGRAQPGFDKQYVRDWLTSDATGWHPGDAEPPPPLPPDVVERTRERYVQAYERLTGRTWG